jgi:ABC-type lipoprotein export system ATPase subunit
MKSIEIRHVGKRFDDRVLFQDVNLTFEKTGLYVILGDSGSGKSTLLDLLAGLDVNYTGEILVLGSLLKERSEEERCKFRLTRLGYVRQGADLLELESALENVLLPLKATSSLSARLAKRKALDLLTFFGLKEKSLQKANTLSGGERQRVALARALVNDPPVLLADEPTGALDPTNADLIYTELHQLAEKRLVIVVSHDVQRSEKVADHLLYLQDGRFTSKENTPLEKEGAKVATLTSPKNPAIRPSFSLWLQHGYHLLRAKKNRSFLSFSILSFSLLSLGLSLYVSRDLSKNLSAAFTSLTGEGMVVMEKADKGEETFGRIISESEEKVKSIALEHSDIVSDYGLSYLAPFETYFPDQNQAVVSCTYGEVVIPSLNARTANDFLWLDNYDDLPFYPACPALLEEEQIVLGLPYSSMVSICLNLHILRNYETLGQYLSIKPLELTLQLANASWNYSDEQLLSVVAVTPSEVPTIYHYDHRWSSYLLEEKMRFPTSDENDTRLPWIMQKVYYLEPKVTPYEFMKNVREEADLSPYVFERASYTFEQTHCAIGAMTSLKRFYVFLADKHSLAPELIAKISANPAFSSFSVCASGSYQAFPEALTSGFANPFFLAKSVESATSLIDAVSSVPLDQAMVEPTLPNDAVEGSFLKPLAQALSFSSDFSLLKSGRKPVGEEEVCLSSHLLAKWGNPQEVYGAALVSSETVGDKLERDYRLFSLKVVGSVRSDNDVLYGESYWTIDFFRDILGMSAFSLEPEKLMLHLRDSSESEAVLSELGAAYPQYRFTDPSLSVKQSLSQVISYVDLLLKVASAITLTISAFLLLTVALLSSLENRNEGKMLFTLGLPREDVAESYGATLCLLTGASAVLAVGELIGSEYLFDRAIQGNFGTSVPFELDFIPIGGILVAAFFGLFLAFALLRNWIYKRDFTREGR